MFYINPGELRHNITIQYDASGGTDNPNWQTLYSTWAAKKAFRNKLYYSAAETQSENDVIFTIRFHVGITPTMQIVDGGQTYEITADPIDPQDECRWLEINARRISQNGS